MRTGSVVDSDLNLVVADPVKISFLARDGDPLTHVAESSQLIGIKLDHLALLCQLVPLKYGFVLQVPLTYAPELAERLIHREECSLNHSGDVTEVQTLML